MAREVGQEELSEQLPAEQNSPSRYKQFVSARKKKFNLDPYVLRELGLVVTAYYKLALSDKLPSFSVVKEMQSAMILTAMRLCNGNANEAAKYLGINRTTVSEMYKRYNPNHRTLILRDITLNIRSVQEVPQDMIQELRDLVKKYGY